MQAVAYGNVYVAQVAMGANPQQTLQAFREAEAYPGVSLILAYSHCIAHGFDLKKGLQPAGQGGGQRLLAAAALRSGAAGMSAKRRSGSTRRVRRITFKDYAYNELRYRALAASRPEEAAVLLDEAQRLILEKYHTYEEFARHGRGPGRLACPGRGRQVLREADMDLTTQYLGLTLNSPLVASPSPPNRHVDHLKLLEEYGAGAVVLPSIFEEQIAREQEMVDALIGSRLGQLRRSAELLPRRDRIRLRFRRAICGSSRRRPRRSKIPVIASLNGITASGWIEHARDDGSRRCAGDRAQHLLRALRHLA